MAEIIDGKLISKQIKAEVKQKAEQYRQIHGVPPFLSVVLVGDDPASAVYVNNKKKACEQAGINENTIALDKNTQTEELLALIEKLNGDNTVNGILVQLPLPEQIDTLRILSAIAPSKDVDGFHPLNCGLMYKDRADLEPCTPKGCMELLKRYHVPLAGANAVIIGRSNLVGKPLARMMERENATVTLCHSRTKDMRFYTKNADIVVVATGKPGLLRGEDIKPGAVVLDVGINRKSDGTLCGDADFESVSRTASLVTPVPGGVGPMTIAMLLENTCIAAEAQNA